MKLLKKSWLLFLGLFQVTQTQDIESLAQALKALTQTTAPFALPFKLTFDYIKATPVEKNDIPKITKKDFEETVKKALATSQQLFTKGTWLENEQLKKYEPKENRFFVEKVIVAENSVIEVHADYHGDYSSLDNWLAKLRADGWFGKGEKINTIIKPDHYLIFLGDYVDRGMYGVEVLKTVLDLFNANPNNVFVIRGNHENLNVNSIGGFIVEFLKKIPYDDDNQFNKACKNLTNLYNSLPLALFLGYKNKNATDYILFCHGAPARNHDIKDIKTLLATPEPIVFTKIWAPLKAKQSDAYDWNDINLNDMEKTSMYIGDRSWVYPVQALETWLADVSTPKNIVWGIVKGHQHKYAGRTLKNHTFALTLPVGAQVLKRDRTIMYKDTFLKKAGHDTILNIVCKADPQNWPLLEQGIKKETV